jgi:predicted lipoprotein
MITFLVLALAASSTPADESADRAAKQAWATCLSENADTLAAPTATVDTVVQAAFAACAAEESRLQASARTQLRASHREWLTGMIMRVRQMNERAQELQSR